MKDHPLSSSLVASHWNIAENFAKYFANISNDIDLGQNFLIRKQSNLFHLLSLDFTHTETEPYNNLITKIELLKSIHNTKRATVEPDHFYINLLKNASNPVIDTVLLILNSIWRTSEILSFWRTAIVISLLKSKLKTLSLLLDSYRPFLLTSVLCKILERIVNNKLSWFVESRQLINNNQFGFRRATSTIDQLLAKF